jgi:aspartyl-tRNA(Asn)/glutamyl-tRNA(Gln) amidotransferase subunit A
LELPHLSLAETMSLLQTRQISPVELTLAYLEAIAALDPQLNSFITVTAELALAQARQAEETYRLDRTREDEQPGLLNGIPLALKDLFETAGIPTTAGSRFFANYLPGDNAFVVHKLLAAGAVFLGKTNLHEIALGLTNVNPHYGACHNPWALDRVSGGSSGGSAAAVAAHLCLGALGTDTGGSIRVPAALCGIVGLKPTRGRVSLRGVIPLSWNLDHVGPMARQVWDAAVLLQAIAGYDPLDPYSMDVPVDDYLGTLKDSIRGWKIGWLQGDYFKHTQPEVEAAMQQAVDSLVNLGACVEPVGEPGLHQMALSNGLMTTADGAAFHAERLRERPGDFGEDVLQRLCMGRDLPLQDYIQARRTQDQARRRFATLFEQYDALILPVTPAPAPPISGPNAVEMARLLTRYTAPFNLTGLPALSLPCGFASLPGRPGPLPVGLQIVGPAWGEARILRIGYAYEQANEWHKKFPPILSSNK